MREHADLRENVGGCGQVWVYMGKRGKGRQFWISKTDGVKMSDMFGGRVVHAGLGVGMSKCGQVWVNTAKGGLHWSDLSDMDG